MTSPPPTKKPRHTYPQDPQDPQENWFIQVDGETVWTPMVDGDSYVCGDCQHRVPAAYYPCPICAKSAQARAAYEREFIRRIQDYEFTRSLRADQARDRVVTEAAPHDADTDPALTLDELRAARVAYYSRNQ